MYHCTFYLGTSLNCTSHLAGYNLQSHVPRVYAVRCKPYAMRYVQIELITKRISYEMKAVKKLSKFVL